MKDRTEPQSSMTHRTDSPDQNIGAEAEHAPGTYYVATDEWGEPTLWRAATDPDSPERMAGEWGMNPDFWPLLAGIVTQDAETMERAARALAASVASDLWSVLTPDQHDMFRSHARAVVSGLLPGTEAGS